LLVTWGCGLPQVPDVSGVRATAAAKDYQVRQVRCQQRVVGSQHRQVTAVEISGLVEFGMASLGRVVTQAENAVFPGPERSWLARTVQLVEGRRDVAGMRAVDHEVLGASRRVYLSDRGTQQGPVREAAVAFHCERDRDGQPGVTRGHGDADRLSATVERHGAGHVGT